METFQDSINDFKKKVREASESIVLMADSTNQSLSEVVLKRDAMLSEIDKLVSVKDTLIADNAKLTVAKEVLEKTVTSLRAVLSSVKF